MSEDTRQVYAYDTTLRDGCQAEGVALTVEQKLEVAQRLDDLGVHYVEGGFPLSNPKDQEFFQRVRGLGLKHARVSAFGSTRKAGSKAEEDRGLAALLEAETEVVALVAKAWDLHVKNVLRTTVEENLRMVEDSVRLLKAAGREVIFDAEHFFDGYRDEPAHAMKVVEVAAEAGADCVVLCDTNGGALTDEVARLTAEVVERLPCPVGIHCHNDSGLAVANSIAAIQSGAVHVQGTMNGLGERVGNADLCCILPIVNLRTGCRCISPAQLCKLTEVSRFAYEVANLIPNPYQPFVGKSAFAHKGGLHHDAMRKDRLAYEHIDPALVGNEQRFLLSELSGRASMLAKMEKSDIAQDPEVVRQLLDRLQDLENEGYQFEAAEASFELVAQKVVGRYSPHFDVRAYHVSVIRQPDGSVITDGTVKLSVNGTPMHTASEGNGPVNALDGALRKALEPHYPALKDMHLTDFSVRVINPKAATEARVRVVIQSADPQRTWGTVGVDENIIEASWQALVDSIEYKLLMED